MSETTCGRPTFVVGTPKTYGIPATRYISPLVRINGVVQDAPVGYKVKVCHLPMDKIAAATNQTLALVGNQLSISEGNTVTLPASSFARTSAPIVRNNPAVPTGFVGTGSYLLSSPEAFIQITADGVTYKVPAYTAGNASEPV